MSMVENGLVCDQMLKRLARWLRMAGYDVLAPDGIDDDGLFEMARCTGRALLTRDKDLSNRKGIRSMRIVSDDLADQLREVIAEFQVPTGSFARCPICNGALVVAEDAGYGNDVPKGVLERQDTIYRCSSCGKVYWEGTHWEWIAQHLASFGIHPHLPDGPEGKSNQAA